jgi:hypothetical protein
MRRIPLTERLDRLSKWWLRENDRPLIGFHTGQYFPLKMYANGTRRLPDGLVQPEDIVVADYLEDADRLFHWHEEAGGDMIWSSSPFWGIPWMEAALGCQVIADHFQGCSRALPPPGFADNPQIPKFSESNPWVAKMLEFIPALERQSAGRYPVGAPLLRGPSDCLSALYGGDSFIYRMLDAPGEIRGVMEQITEFWIALGQCLLNRLPLFHGGTNGLIYGIWSPGKMIWLQEDASALLSPALYEKFIYPADCRIACAFERVIVHLHPSRFLPVEYLARTEVGAFELSRDSFGPSAEAHYPQLKKLIDARPLLVYGAATAEDVEFMLTRLPHRGLAISLPVESAAEAEAIWERALETISRGAPASDV